jgi:ATP-binding cassette subfamily B protein
MQGQRTRIVQEPRERWLVEDAHLARYLAESRRLDRATVRCSCSSAAAGSRPGPWPRQCARLGHDGSARAGPRHRALLLGQQAVSRLASGLVQLSACAVAWRQVAPVFAAARRREDAGLSRTALRPARAEHGEHKEHGTAPPLVVARDLSFRHAGREREALSGAGFEVHAGESVLVEGPSGGGKSTLVSLLSGWRRPSSGTLLLSGLDRASQGAARWRRRIAAAPQFHENHVFTGTMAFNLLLSAPPEPDAPPGARAVPPEVRAEERALEVCAELGLGPLLERMPSGLRQVLGETGWRLAREKSRLFVARTLLADASPWLDGRPGALDPETARVLQFAGRRALVLVAVRYAGTRCRAPDRCGRVGSARARQHRKARRRRAHSSGDPT